MIRSRAAVVIAVLALSACDFFRGYAEGASSMLARQLSAHPPGGRQELGAARFVFDDFHSLNTDTLETNALPWKLVVAAMLVARPELIKDAPSEDDWLLALEQRYGFVRPSRIANWPSDAQPRFDRNLGIVAGTIARDVPRVRFEAINHGCATCHAAPLWDAQGIPTREVWLGLGATSIHLARYSSEVYAGLQLAARKPAPVIAMLDRIYPDLDADERKTLLELVLPAIQKTIGASGAPREPVPFDNGGPGLTNSVGHVKRHFAILDVQHAQTERAFTQIPELMSMPLRTSVLCDGVYTPKGHAPFAARAADAADRVPHTVKLADVATLFTVGTLGVQPERAHKNLPLVQDVMAMVADLQGPPWPGSFDAERATRGLAVFSTRCASCHGTVTLTDRRARVTTFPNRLIPLDVIGTDRVRALAANADVLAVINTVPVGRNIDAVPRQGYVAPTLIGLWATAPYLHNGSVPTLWHLMHPAERPARFQQGGHALDLERVGIAYPDGFEPWVVPDVFDATTPGRTNVGHVTPFDVMSEDEKADVLELLKAL